MSGRCVWKPTQAHTGLFPAFVLLAGKKYRPGAGVLNGTELRSRTLCSGKTSITKRFRKGTEKVLMKVPPAPDPIGHPGALAFLMVGDFKFAA
jgi:hypothetical protein